MRAITVAVYLLVVVCISITQVVSQSHNFEIIPMRVDRGNLVRLQCRRIDSMMLGSTTIFFFLNASTSEELASTIVYSMDEISVSAYSVEYIFGIDRLADEGNYSCGNTTEPDSGETPVIAYPQFDFQVNFDGITTIRAKAGSTAVLPPYIRTGNWHSRYYIDWYKDGNLVGRIDGLRSSSNVDTVPERFSVDPVNFSLMIRSVSRSDSGQYFGMLGVTEGQNLELRGFNQTENMAITLEVYDEPMVIMDKEQSNIVVRNENDFTFECNATGYPVPTIVWKHHFSSGRTESMNIIIDNDRVHSRLTLTNAHPEDSGKVGCYAIVEPGGNVAPLQSETAVSNFSVLQIFEVQAYRTTRDILVFTIHLGDNVMVPAELRVEVMMKGSNTIHTSSDLYHGTNPITYLLEQPSSDLLNSEVYVSILSRGSNGLVTSTPRSMDLSMEADSTCSYIQEVITIVVPVGAVFIIIIVIAVLITVCYWRSNTELIRNCNNLRDVYNNPEASKEEKEEAFGYLLHCLKLPSRSRSTSTTTTKTGSSSKTRKTENAYETVAESPQRMCLSSADDYERGIIQTYTQDIDRSESSQPEESPNTEQNISPAVGPEDDVGKIRTKGPDHDHIVIEKEQKIPKGKKKYQPKGITDEEAIALARNFLN